MTQIKLRRDTSTAFASSNPILGNGEPAYETDTKKLKIGDGTTAYTQLEYFSAGGGSSTNISATLPLKIVDGVISLEVDGQTIQIVDGKLHASDGLELCDTDIVIRDDEKMFTQLQQMRRSTFDLSKFGVVGSPTITEDGIISTTAWHINYAKANFNISTLQNKSWHIRQQAHINFEKIIDCAVLYSDGTYLAYRNDWNSLVFNNYTTTDGTATNRTLIFIAIEQIRDKILNVTPNVTGADLIIDLYYNLEKQEYYFTATYEGVTWKSSVFTGTMETYNSQLAVLYNTNGYLKLGQYSDLKNFSITVDGKEVFNGNKTGLDVIKPDNYEVVGSPAISEDGVASGFSSGNYLRTKSSINFSTASSWEIISPKFKTTINSDRVQYIICKDNTGSSSGCIHASIQPNGNIDIVCVDTNWSGAVYRCYGTKKIDPNNWYQTKVKFTGTQYEFYYKENDDDWTSYGTANGSSISLNATYLDIGQNINAYFMDGSIDLNAFKIYVDGNLVYQPCLKIPYTESKTGSKIVDEVYRDRVIDLYEQQGQAGYYTIDEENKNFTLPMGEIYGMIGQRSLISSTVTETNRVDIYSDKTCLICGNVATAGTINLPIELGNNNYFITLSTSAKTATSFTTTATGDYILIGKVV